MHTELIEVSFWLSWLIVPIIFELLPACYSFITLLMANSHFKNLTKPKKLPFITLIIPVYNSEDTIFNCIASIDKSSYPNKLIKVLVVNNQSSDSSQIIYKKAREKFATLNMQWLSTDKGKARALNSAIYNSIGKYVIHIDSDGILHQDALMNMIVEFENDSTIDALTGTILTQKELIDTTQGKFLKFIRKNEFFEYAQSFLAGRATESQNDHLFTMSGAFSAFRKDRLFQTKMYNISTVGEDIDMTFQIRYQLQGNVYLCPQALFYVYPLDDMNKLYTQRQRWERGELEALSSFMTKKSIGIHMFFKNFVVRRLLIDHTILLIRLIWLFALILMLSYGYSGYVLLISFTVLYLFYVGLSALNYINIAHFLKNFPENRKYYLKNWYILLTLPLYYILCNFIQSIGIINSMSSSAQWTTKSFSDEMKQIKLTFKKIFHKPRKLNHDH